MPHLRLRDGHIYYEVHGESGEWITFIHGAFASHKWWKLQAEEFSKSYRVLTFDLRGHGSSSPLSHKASLEEFVEDLHTLHRHLGVEKTALVGWSLGGMVAMKYAVTHPDVVRALILISTRMRRRRFYRVRATVTSLVARLSTMLEFAQLIEPMQLREVPDYCEEFRRALRNGVSREVPLEYLEEIVRDFMQSSARESYGLIVKGIGSFDLSHELNRIKAPTLILVGDMDDRTPVKFSHEIHSRIVGSRLKVIRGGSHYMIVEQPRLVNLEIEGFLRELGY